MYSVSRQTHPKHGNVIQIVREDGGIYQTPGLAYNYAAKTRRLWKEESNQKVRFLIDDQIMTSAQAETWVHVEYKSLPKCHVCSAILQGRVFTHKQCGEYLFCSSACADKDYQIYLDNLLDEEEIDYL